MLRAPPARRSSTPLLLAAPLAHTDVFPRSAGHLHLLIPFSQGGVGDFVGAEDLDGIAQDGVVAIAAEFLCQVDGRGLVQQSRI